jgi:Domain of unknown function (DUF4334)/GXWXG protein
VDNETLSSLARLQTGTDIDTALSFYDSLSPVEVPAMMGNWRGHEFLTGNPLDGLLKTYGWYGKRFEGPDAAQPLVFRRPNGTLFCVNPSRLPMSLIVKYANSLRHKTLAGFVRRTAGILATDQPQARLRMTRYRGIVSATIIYDTLPINDMFRMVDPDTLVGVMDLRGLKAPFLFVLKRETGA